MYIINGVQSGAELNEDGMGFGGVEGLSVSDGIGETSELMSLNV